MAVFTGLGSAASPSITFSADTNTGVFSPGADTLALATAGANRLHITSAGLVGIGTASPTAKLEVVSIPVAVSQSAVSARFGSGSNTYDFRIENNIDGVGNPFVVLRGPDGGAPYTSFVQGSVERLRITSTGQLAFGEAGSIAFSTSLGAAGTYAEIKTFNVLAPATPATNIRFLRDVPLVGNDGAICFDTTGTERARIDSSGRVGIGTTTPQARLEVTGGSLKLRQRTGGANYAYEVDADNVEPYSQKMITTRYMDEGGGSFVDMTSINTDVESAGGNQYALTFKTTGQPLGGGSPEERMRITGLGIVLVGATSARANFYNSTVNSKVLLESTGVNSGERILANVHDSATASGPILLFGKSRSASIGGNTVVVADDSLGELTFQGNDGTEFVEAASIKSFVDGTPGANDMPGRLVFSTTADGAASPTERLRITSAGNVGINTTSPTVFLDVNADTVRVRTARTPASASATGAVGEICWDTSYIYVCTATNTWKRVAIATW